MKKTITILLTLLTSGSLLTACGNTEKKTVDEPKSSEKSSKKEKASEPEIEEEEPEPFDPANYRTDITYDQIARTPDEFEGEQLKLEGKVIQVLEGKGNEIQMRIAIGGDYDKVVYVGYDKDIMDGKRVLENDLITFYGTSVNTVTYDSTMNGKITVPAIKIDKIEDKGTAPEDYGY